MSVLRKILLAVAGGGSFAAMTDLSHLVFDVKAYGALGDGSTDDTTAIGAAITAACSIGGIVWFPPGTYLVSTTLTISCDGVTLAGAGPKASILKADTGLDADDVLFFDGVSGGGAEGLGITSAAVKSGGAAILTDGCFQVRFEQLLITNQFDSFHLVDSTVVRITDCDLYNQDRHGIWIDCDTGNDFYLTGIVADNTPPSSGQGIYVSGGDAVILSNCDFLHFENGLLIQPTAGRHSEWHFFTGAIFDNCTNDGIHIGGEAGDTHGITFANSWSSSNGNQGLYIGDGAGDLQGIEFGDGKLFSNGNNGVQVVSPATRVTITDSQISGNSVDSAGTHDGISVAAGVTHLTIVGNQCHNVLGSGTQGYGLHFDSGATDYVIVQANDFTGNATGGIENQGGVTGVNLSITGNLV